MELLLPAGDPEKLRYAFAYGADAVYAGVPLFSLRARENGFREENLREAIVYAHSIDRKIYLTMNIYADNSRVDRFLDSFCRMQDAGPDGFIMSDVGLIRKALQLRPDATIHLSTQANATNWAAVEFWRDAGVKRVILSRELSIPEISEIHRKVPEIELEVFVHGSICIAYSGRCLISNYINHRSANEGTCTNSCRWNYSLGVKKGSLLKVENAHLGETRAYEPLGNEYYITEGNRPDRHFEMDEDEHGTYMMNSRDLCGIELLGELRDAGVMSVKVEGRAKSLYYVAAVGRAYRRALDDLRENRPFNAEHLAEVASTANRSLMTGFLVRRPREYGQNYSDGCSLPLTHQYAGQVLEVDRILKRALVRFKTSIVMRDILEWLSGSETIPLGVVVLLNSEGEPLSAIHGGQVGWINCPDETTDLFLLRKRVERDSELTISKEAHGEVSLREVNEAIVAE